jgi:hypothetical protein
MKTKPDTLEGQLRARQRLDEFMIELIDNCISLKAALALCEKWGVGTSISSVSRLVSSYGLHWRIQRAKEAAEASEKSSPADIEGKIRRGLSQREFEKVYGELTVKEIVALKRCELAASKLEVDKRKLALLEAKMAEAKSKLESVKSKGGLTPETLKEIEEAAKLL